MLIKKYFIFALLLLATLVPAKSESWIIPFNLSNPYNAPGQTSLGSFVAEAIRYASDAQIAFISKASIRDKQLEAGEYDEIKLCSYLFYPDDHIAKIMLSGEEIYKILEENLMIYPQKNPAFLQVAGIVVYFSYLSPPNQRIKKVLLLPLKTILEPKEIYTVAVEESLAKGMGGCLMLREKEATYLPITLLESVKKYLDSGIIFNNIPLWIQEGKEKP